MNKAIRTICLCLAAIAAVAGLAAADVVHLKSGGKVEGTILSRSEAEVVVQTAAGKVTLKAADVVRVEQKTTPFEVYREMTAKVAADDADGHFALGLWCADHKLSREAREEFQKAIAVDPNHKGARERLGYVLKDGKWMTFAEAKKADGFVRHGDKWVTEEQRDTAEQRQLVAAWRSRFQRAISKRPTSQQAIAERIREAIGDRPRDVTDAALHLLLLELVKEAAESTRDRSYEARLAIVGVLADKESPEGTEALQKTAVRDVDPRVRDAAIKALAAQNSTDNTAYFVGLLYKFTSPRVRVRGDKDLRMLARRILRRAAEALGGLGDPRAVPALADTMIVRFHVQEKEGELPPMSVGYTANAMSDAVMTDSHGNQFVIPVAEGTNWGLDQGQTERDADDPFFFNEADYNALRKLTGQDFSHEKREWLAWWYRNKHNLVD